jgi:hypothetical protein
MKQISSELTTYVKVSRLPVFLVSLLVAITSLRVHAWPVLLLSGVVLTWASIEWWTALRFTTDVFVENKSIFFKRAGKVVEVPFERLVACHRTRASKILKITFIADDGSKDSVFFIVPFYESDLSAIPLKVWP